ncbi:extracellular solute-binding protein [Saccharibacillus sp. CPCC 101409]|uniref:extracellular solute-binding protein n=1 Tax=Saccharibacillus sp. CPCC 101409 TaxID=3058041 RepID=UPI002672B28F|nr:extracellular solute-binding protein [Saccharibacillus sp. CPCC 101409]MDO3413365.1 extracellular solute-binding protein [Saccharibacillus sp. CPCC 101409]
MRKITALTGSMLLTVALAACGGGGNSSGGAYPSPGGAQPADTSKTAEPSESGGATTITVLNEGAVSIGVGKLDDLFAAKEKEYKDAGTDIEYTPGSPVQTFPLQYQKIMSAKLKEQNISVNTEDWGWGEPLIQKQTAGFLAKNIPDIIVGETQMPGFAQQGLLEPFPDDMADYVRENVSPAAWKPMELDGKIYGLAAQPGVSSLYWNKKLVEQAGIDPDKVITTWQELRDNAKAVTEAGGGKFYGGGVYAAPNFGGYLRYGALIAINGGAFSDENGQPAFNSAQNAETVALLRDLNKAHPPGLMVNNNEGSYFDAWNKGQIAYLIDGPWRVQESATAGLDLGMAPIPLSPGGKAANVTIGAAFHAVPKDAKHKEAAFEYIKVMYSKEIQQLVADSNTRSPILKEIGESKEYQDKHPEMYLHYQAMSGDVMGLPTFTKDNSKAWQIWGDAVVKSMMTDGDIQTILDDAQKRAEMVTK